MPLDPNQRTRLLAAKARALVGDATGIDQSELRTTPFIGGAMVHVGEALWCLLDDGAIRSFGPAMVLADRERFETFHVMAESEATSGVLARRAAQFTNGPSVWRIEGRTLVAAVPAPTPADAAQYYPAIHWYSMLKIPEKDQFGVGGGIPASITQESWLAQMKNQGCVGCHQLGQLSTRTIPKRAMS